MTENIINVLLFLLPGILAMLIESNVSGDSGKPRGDLEKTIEGVILSVPVFVLSLALITLIDWIFVKYFHGTWWTLSSISEVESWLNSLKHLLLYIFCSVPSAVLIGFLWAKQSNPGSLYIKFFNWLRVKMRKAQHSGFNSVWDSLLNNQDEVVVSLETKDGKQVKGFLKGFSQSGDKPREITLYGFNVVAEKYKDYLNEPKIVYHNLDTGTLLTFYDMNAVKDLARASTPCPPPSY